MDNLRNRLEYSKIKMRARFALVAILLIILACEVVPVPPSLQNAGPVLQTVSEDSAGTPTSLMETPGGQVSPLMTSSVIPTEAPGELAPFPVKATRGFIEPASPHWQPGTFSYDIELPISLDELANSPVIAGLNLSQRDFLAKNGFIVIPSHETQFGEIRHLLSMRYGQPYYLTTDSAYHALQLALLKMIVALEKEELRPRLLATVKATYDEVAAFQPYLQGTVLEEDCRLALAYLGVPLKLLDPQVSFPPSLEVQVRAAVEQLLGGKGVEKSVLLKGFEEDTSAYLPFGHYSGDGELENYFRAITWLWRAHFHLQPQEEDTTVSRVPLIITLALRRGNTSSGTAAEEWAELDEVISYLIGASDESGPRQYANLMDQVYGRRVSILDLANEALWQDFLNLAQELPSYQPYPVFATSLEELGWHGGWRFIGQRFTLDAFILQNLVFGEAEASEDQRLYPSGLDLMGALGSQAAVSALERSEANSIPTFVTQFGKMQVAARSLTDVQWLSAVPNAWLYSFLPQITPKDDVYPSSMRTSAWAYRELSSALGGWANLHRDQKVEIAAVEDRGRRGGITSGPAPAYVEPNPNVFYRLASLAESVTEGLSLFGFTGSDRDSTDADSLQESLADLHDLGQQLKELGNVATKELAGATLSSEDYRKILAPLGAADAQVVKNLMAEPGNQDVFQAMPSMPVTDAIPGAGARKLQVGLGWLNRILVVVPLEGQLYVAQGGVFTYYEFPQFRNERLTNEVWRQLLLSLSPALPEWSAIFIIPGGVPVDVLAFRIGDVYRITQAGAQLNMRVFPSLAASVKHQLEMGEYVKFIDGPVDGGGYTWWKVSLEPSQDPPLEGWVVLDPTWFERAWGQ